MNKYVGGKFMNKNKEVIEKVGKKGKILINDFKSFAMKGNIIDLAVGVVIGTAFTKIVNSLVSEIVTPAISLLTGKVSVANLFVALSTNQHFATIEEAKAAGISTINYGMFLSSIIDFVIIAFTIFLVLRYTTKKNKKQEESMKDCPYCFSSINIKASRCPSCTSELTSK